MKNIFIVMLEELRVVDFELCITTEIYYYYFIVSSYIVLVSDSQLE